MSAEVTEGVSTAAGGEAESIPEPKAPASQPQGWKLRIQQGVLGLAEASGRGGDLRTILLEPLIQKLGSANSNGGELLFTLAEKEVTCDFSISSLTCQTIISGDLGMAEGSTTGGALNPEAEPPLNKHLNFQSTARGEVTFTDNQISQFGISMIQSSPASPQGGTLWGTSELTESGIAHLPLSPSVKVSNNEDLGTVGEILQHLQLLIRADRTNVKSFKILCHLWWKGGISKEIIQKIDTQKPSLVWEALVVWKALGESEE
jgi:hypothetical protein